MKKLLLLLLLSLGFIGSSYADAICNDGWISKSSGSGTCSWHGGVKKWLNKKKSYDGNDDYFPSDPPPLCDKKPKYARGINGMTFETKEQCLNRFKKQREMLIERILEKKIQDDKKNRLLNLYLDFINNN